MALWCWAVGLFGAILAGAGVETTSGPARWVFAVLHGPGDLNLDAQMRFSVALMGAAPVPMGWSLALLAVIEAANQLGESGRPTGSWWPAASSVGP